MKNEVRAGSPTMPDTPEHAFTEAGKTLAAELYKSDPWGPAAVAAVEKQAAQRAIDALTAAVEGINTEAGEWDEERMRAAVLAILRGEQLTKFESNIVLDGVDLMPVIRERLQPLPGSDWTDPKG